MIFVLASLYLCIGSGWVGAIVHTQIVDPADVSTAYLTLHMFAWLLFWPIFATFLLLEKR